MLKIHDMIATKKKAPGGFTPARSQEHNDKSILTTRVSS